MEEEETAYINSLDWNSGQSVEALRSGYEKFKDEKYNKELAAIAHKHRNWLKKFIAVGARANGALQVNVKDLFSLPFPYPNLNEEPGLDLLLLWHQGKSRDRK